MSTSRVLTGWLWHCTFSNRPPGNVVIRNDIVNTVIGDSVSCRGGGPTGRRREAPTCRRGRWEGGWAGTAWLVLPQGPPGARVFPRARVAETARFRPTAHGRARHRPPRRGLHPRARAG